MAIARTVDVVEVEMGMRIRAVPNIRDFKSKTPNLS